jgi:hypothetical protein
MVFGILIATGLFYLIFADGSVQKWNDPNAADAPNAENGSKYQSVYGTNLNNCTNEISSKKIVK